VPTRQNFCGSSHITKGEPGYAPAEDCSRRSYPAGTAFVDPGHGHVHTAFQPD
jgi:hypothetical protein